MTSTRRLISLAVVTLVAAGVMVPEAVAAARILHDEGVAANVLCLTSPGRLYRELKEARRHHLLRGTSAGDTGHLDELIPPDERAAPIVTRIPNPTATPRRRCRTASGTAGAGRQGVRPLEQPAVRPGLRDSAIVTAAICRRSPRVGLRRVGLRRVGLGSSNHRGVTVTGGERLFAIPARTPVRRQGERTDVCPEQVIVLPSAP